MALSDRLPALIRTAQELASLRGAALESRVLELGAASLVASGYDNWNGGVDYFTLVIEVPVAMYVGLEAEQERLESSIADLMSRQTRMDSGEAITEVVITPVAVEDGTTASAPMEQVGEGDELVPGFWQPGYFRLFISHLSSNKAQAHALKTELARFQIVSFVAHDDIEPSREWQDEIESALRTMDALTALLAPEFVNSRWCDQEVGYALGRRKFVLGLRMGADPHGFLGKYQGLTVTGMESAPVAESVFGVLIQHEATTQRMTESLVERLVRSSSWESSKRTMTLLERATSLNAGQSSRLLRSIEDNIDVGDAFGVPDRIRSLIARIGAGSS